ncbi:MAG: U32 family peptidase [Abditibacteriota bacterium]|nr:U32 family peptidase [Abditibacteriota bacterium]
MIKTELLAPAGDLVCGKAAVDAGADAVYIGASRYGAREKAANSPEDIRALCLYAHRYDVRVYATVNTILFEKETEDCRRLILELWEAGVDGIILQDPAILEMELPPVKLIASTQMNCGTPEKIRLFYDAGIRRFILPRELSLGEMAAIRTAVPEDAELEAFVHGALCVARSGECYLSWYIGGRSGNRGCCAQPCRNRYELKDADGTTLARGHLLSLKDLDLSGRLKDLLRAGITSFKIEGRLKGPDYITNTVAWYRAALDRVLEEEGAGRASRGVSVPDREFRPDPAKTFNRGFTEYMLDGRQKGVSSMDTPSMKGEEIGVIKKVRGKRVFLDRQAELRGGDGVAFFYKGVLKGTNVNLQESPDSVTVNDPAYMTPGAVLYRNLDAAWRKTIPVYRRYIPVFISVRQTEEGLAYVIDDGSGHSFAYTDATPYEEAKDGEKALATLKRQLGKRSEEGFFTCAGVEADTERPPFIPIGRINEIRRTLHSGLASVLASRGRTEERAERRLSSGDPAPTDYRANVANSLSREFYRRRGVPQVEPAPEAGTDLRGRQVMECAYCLRRELGLCMEDKSMNRPLTLENQDVKLRAVFDCGHCLMRLYAADKPGHRGNL